MDKVVLSAEDLAVLNDFKTKKIKIGSLSSVFSKINLNEKLSSRERYYLKKIMIDNINNAFLRRQNEQDQ